MTAFILSCLLLTRNLRTLFKFKILVHVIVLTYSLSFSAEDESNRFEIYSLN